MRSPTPTLMNASFGEELPQAANISVMTSEEREKMNRLCLQIQVERDPKVFDRLLRELNDLLEIKQNRIAPEKNAPVR
jgi:hypothetical protein